MRVEVVWSGCAGRSIELYAGWLQASLGLSYSGKPWAWVAIGGRMFRILPYKGG